MRDFSLLLLIIYILIGCSRSETKQNNANNQTVPAADSSIVTVPKARNCQSVVETGKLSKADVYQESAKAINVTLTVEQDTSTVQATADCFFNNVVTVLAAKKSGIRVFKRTLSKDDLLYFVKTDEIVERGVLQRVTYKPTFNPQKYITITMRLVEPGIQKTTDYTVFLNYFGEIIKVR